MKKDGRWVPFTMDSCTGIPTREEIWLGMEGKDIVVKLTSGDTVYYIAGTDALRAHYEGKGYRSISFPQAVEMMKKVNTPFFDQALIDNYIAAMAVFPGVALSQVTDIREENDAQAS